MLEPAAGMRRGRSLLYGIEPAVRTPADCIYYGLNSPQAARPEIREGHRVPGHGVAKEARATEGRFPFQFIR